MLDCAITAFSERYCSTAARTVTPRWMNMILWVILVQTYRQAVNRKISDMC